MIKTWSGGSLFNYQKQATLEQQKARLHQLVDSLPSGQLDAAEALLG